LGQIDQGWRENLTGALAHEIFRLKFRSTGLCSGFFTLLTGLGQSFHGFGRDREHFLCEDAEGQLKAFVIAVPFLRPGDVPIIPESSEGYLARIREFYRRAT
jgi:hypothetical protein